MTTTQNNKTMHIILWVLQGLFAAMFLMAGQTKLFQPIEAMAESMPWVFDVPEGLVRFIGISEFLGGIGLVLPSLIRIKPALSVWASLGLATVMVFAAIFHASRGEFPAIGANALFIVFLGIIAWGRSKKAPIAAK